MMTRCLVATAAIATLIVAASAQEAPRKHRALVEHKASSARHICASLSPTDFPIRFTAYERVSKDNDTPGTVLVLSRNGYQTTKSETLFTKDLEGSQISSVVSWQNPDRTHFGFLVLTTPAEGNLYGVMFFLYHDGKLSMPIDDIATGYPVIPTITKSDKTGQIQISYDEGNLQATNDKVKTVVIYTWSDWSRRFVKVTHEVAAESVHRARRGKPTIKARRVEKTEAAEGDDGQ